MCPGKVLYGFNSGETGEKKPSKARQERISRRRDQMTMFIESCHRLPPNQMCGLVRVKSDRADNLQVDLVG
ncbi:hypothetical protein BGP75_10480 [Motiliproteus sp. MSK22-1]|nr:hypothetical protein BGP75_10480 [Motiliproteus sp. MSK22-1]